MFPVEIISTYCLAVLIVVLAPGPDNLMAVSRGLSQGSTAALCSAVGNAAGIFLHTLSATFGLLIVLQASDYAFLAIKLLGAGYLIYLGVKAIRSRNLIVLEAQSPLSYPRIFWVGLLMNFFNPKPGLFILAFIPQFVSPDRGAVHWQTLMYGFIFALATIGVFTLMGAFASRLAFLLRERSKFVLYLNRGVGLALILSGMSILALGDTY